eukprot:gene9864-2209_t
MPQKDGFKVSLTVNGAPLREVYDTVTKRYYAVCSAGDEYKIKMESEDGDSHYGAIIQLDGLPHTAEFSKSPFTFFKKPYEDPGFWINPREGKYTPRFFSQPSFEQEPEDHRGGGSAAAGAAAQATNENIGRIRIYFFDVEKSEPKGAPKDYSAPDSSTVKEGKKWFLAGSTTRYGKAKATGSTGGTWKISDRKKPKTFAELLPPSVRAKRAREEREDAIRKRGRKGNVDSVGEDGGVIDSDDDDVEKKDKPPPEVITISDDSDDE